MARGSCTFHLSSLHVKDPSRVLPPPTLSMRINSNSNSNTSSACTGTAEGRPWVSPGAKPRPCILMYPARASSAGLILAMPIYKINI